jgi:hypothetical protein
MFTLNYKGWYVNGYCDRPQCRVLLPDSTLWGTFKSLQAAKVAITKAHKWVKVKAKT